MDFGAGPDVVADCGHTPAGDVHSVVASDEAVRKHLQRLVRSVTVDAVEVDGKIIGRGSG